MRAPYREVTDEGSLLSCLREQATASIVVDIEPMIAFWDTDDDALDRGVRSFLERVREDAPEIRVVCFATNSRRRAIVAPADGGPLVRYLASAGKPLRVAPYRDLPRPGAVIGDQLATDGLLAWRLGFAFVHARLPLARVPLGPRLMNHLGRPLRQVLFD